MCEREYMTMTMCEQPAESSGGLCSVISCYDTLCLWISSYIIQYYEGDKCMQEGVKYLGGVVSPP